MVVVSALNVSQSIKLNYPHGWLAKSLTQEPLKPIAGASSSVEAFDKAKYW